MFGSDFFGNFGIPQFPFQGMDPQGGMLAGNIPPPGQNTDTTGQQPANVAPAAGLPASPKMPAVGSAGPLGGAVQPPGAGAPLQSLGGPVDPNQGAAPAAGLGSPFGRPTL